MPEVVRDGATVFYEVTGNGPPLMLVPGMLSDGASWLPLVGPLAERFMLILPDPRGAGRTRGEGAITLDTLAADMLAAAADAGCDRFALAGHSMGALVALAMAGQAPGRVTRMAALASSPRPSARVPALFESLVRVREGAGDAAFYEALFPWLFADAFFRDRDAVKAAVAASIAYPHAQPLEAMKRQVSALGRLDLKGLPRQVTVPTLALLAADDAMILPEPAAAVWARMGAAVETVEGAGHSLHWDAPEAVAGRMMAFLSDPGGT